MSDGRVDHRGLELTVDDLVIRTRGSVGVDESLSIVAEVPILDKWVQHDRILAHLRGQVLQIPVEGTVRQPRLDSRALAQLSGQMMRQTAEGWLQDELQKQLNRLLGPSK